MKDKKKGILVFELDSRWFLEPDIVAISSNISEMKRTMVEALNFKLRAGREHSARMRMGDMAPHLPSAASGGTVQGEFHFPRQEMFIPLGSLLGCAGDPAELHSYLPTLERWRESRLSRSTLPLGWSGQKNLKQKIAAWCDVRRSSIFPRSLSLRTTGTAEGARGTETWTGTRFPCSIAAWSPEDQRERAVIFVRFN